MLSGQAISISLFCNEQRDLSSLTTKPTKWHVRPPKTQISLGIHPVWPESSLSAWRKLGSLATHWVHSEDPVGCPGWSEFSLGAHAILLVFVVRLLKSPGWSESSLGAHAILLVLSWGGSKYSLSAEFLSCCQYRPYSKSNRKYLSYVTRKPVFGGLRSSRT